MTQAWRSGRLTDGHDLTGFDCGVSSLTQWLGSHASRAQRAGTARTYVWTAPDDLRVVAYYSVAPTRLVRAELSGGQAGGESVVPAYLLARLALDASLHGQGLGGELLFDALDVLVDAADRVAGRLIVVDAVDDRAASFYQRHGFTPVKGNTHRLVVKVETVRHALGKPDPRQVPGGLAVVYAWLDAVRSDETREQLWVLLDDPLRLTLAQGWIMWQAERDPGLARRDRDDLAYALAPRDSPHPLAARMLVDLHRRWRSHYGALLADAGVVCRVDPAGSDQELVTLSPPGSGTNHHFLTRLVGGAWVVAANAARLPVPGWPPTERDAL